MQNKQQVHIKEKYANNCLLLLCMHRQTTRKNKPREEEKNAHFKPQFGNHSIHMRALAHTHKYHLLNIQAE